MSTLEATTPATAPAPRGPVNYLNVQKTVASWSAGLSAGEGPGNSSPDAASPEPRAPSHEPRATSAVNLTGRPPV